MSAIMHTIHKGIFVTDVHTQVIHNKILCFCCRVSLLVTEVFDAGLLGEGVIPTLYHAWKNLMQPAPLVILTFLSLKICMKNQFHL